MEKDLYEAAIAGDAEAKFKLEMQADTLNLCKETILHIESRRGNAEQVRFILREFANKNLLTKLDSEKNTALHLTVCGEGGGHPKVAELLIEAARHLPFSSPADNNTPNSVSSFQAFLRQPNLYLNTALHRAVFEENVDIVKLLVEADPSDRHTLNQDGETPTYIAAKKRYNDIVKVICRTCTSPFLDGPRGYNALHVAVSYLPDIEVVEVLIGAASRLPPLPSLDNDDTHGPVNSFQAFLRQTHKLSTVLHGAVLRNRVDIVKLLVEADPSDTHTQDSHGYTPLFLAAAKGYTNMVKVICTTCTAPSMDGPGGCTALHAAILNINHGIEVVEAVIDAARLLLSPPPPTSDNDDYFHDPVNSFQDFLRKGDEGSLNTALHMAVMQGHLEVVKLLVEADPSDTHAQNKEGKTPMYIAAESGYYDIIKLICTTCRSPSNLDGPGDTTAFHAAINNFDPAKKEDREVIKIMIDANLLKIAREEGKSNSLFKRTDEYGCTLLELSVELNYIDLVKLILEENPDHKYQKGRTLVGLIPLIYKAMDKGYTDIVELLVESYDNGITVAPFYEQDVPRFIHAIRNRQEELVFTQLKDCDRDLATFVDDLGWTPLHHAAYYEFNSVICPIIEVQKKFGYQFMYKDMVSTPFHVAAEKGYTSTVILLMQHWSSSSSAYTAGNKSGQNVLHFGRVAK